MLNKFIISFVIITSLTGCGFLGLNTAPEVVSNPMTAPSSLPPEGYTAHSWIDSRGCEYLRVGSNSWAPKVTQDGSHLCGGMPEITVTDFDDRVHLDNVANSSQNLQVIQNEEFNGAQANVSNSSVIAQIASFKMKENAESTVSLLKDLGYEVITNTVSSGLQVVSVKSKSGQSADNLLMHMKQLGFSDAFIYFG